MEDDKSKHRDFAPLIEFSDSYTESPSSNDLTETILPHRTLPRLSSSSSESIAPPASSPSTPASAASVAPPFPTPADAGEDPFRFSTSNIQKQSQTIAASANVTEMTEQQKHQSDALTSPQLQTVHKRTDSVGTVRENDAVYFPLDQKSWVHEEVVGIVATDGREFICNTLIFHPSRPLSELSKGKAAIEIPYPSDVVLAILNFLHGRKTGILEDALKPEFLVGLCKAASEYELEGLVDMLQFVIKHNLASMRTFNEAINFYLIGVTLKDEELITSASRKAFSFDTRGDSLQSFLSDDLKAWGGSSAHRNALYILFYHIRSRYSSKLEAAIELCYRLTTKKIQFHYKTRKDEALTPRVECDQRAWDKWASTVMSLVQSNRLPYDSFVATIKNEFEETKCHVCDPRLSVIVGETAFSWNERKRTARTCVSLSDLC